MIKKFSHNVNSSKTIWIDLDNSPHVPFFTPIIRQLQHKGYRVVISARKYSQTVLLANLYGLDYNEIGVHYGKKKFNKIFGLFYRTIQLLPFARNNKPIIALSHGSRAQMLAAAILRIPIIMFLDYEFIQTIPFVKPSIIYIPHVISPNKLKSIAHSIVSYPGIKEDIYVPGFNPNKEQLLSLNRDENKIQIVLRPPAHEAHYHNPESEKLFKDVIDFLTTKPNVQTVILPRDPKQKSSILSQFKEKFEVNSLIIPDSVIDGLNLIWFSDLVISGGGTMNREAAALNIPVYSIFKGKIGDVDKYLKKSGRLTLIKDSSEIEDKIILKKRANKKNITNVNSLALQSVLNSLENFIDNITQNNLNKKKNSHDQYEIKSKENREARNS